LSGGFNIELQKNEQFAERFGRITAQNPFHSMAVMQQMSGFYKCLRPLPMF
jgi:hypothetical protein